MISLSGLVLCLLNFPSKFFDDDLLYVLSSQTGKEITLDVLKIDDFSVIYTKSYTNGLEYDYMVPSCIVELN